MPAKLIKKKTTTRRRVRSVPLASPKPVGREVRSASDLPDDVGVLKETIVHLLASNAKLSEQLEYMLRRYQGRQSEQMDAAQLALFAELLGQAAATAGEDDANAAVETEKKPRSKPSGRRPLPAHLPRVEVDQLDRTGVDQLDRTESPSSATQVDQLEPNCRWT